MRWPMLQRATRHASPSQCQGGELYIDMAFEVYVVQIACARRRALENTMRGETRAPCAVLARRARARHVMYIRARSPGAAARRVPRAPSARGRTLLTGYTLAHSHRVRFLILLFLRFAVRDRAEIEFRYSEKRNAACEKPYRASKVHDTLKSKAVPGAGPWGLRSPDSARAGGGAPRVGVLLLATVHDIVMST